MLFLGIDSSTMVGSVALMEGDSLIAEHTLNLKRTHSERVMVAISGLFSMAGYAPADAGAVCVAIGPGSYTGIRIGVTTAKAIAWSLGVPLIAVSSLEALAQAVNCAPMEIIAAPSIAAKGILVFGAAYSVNREGLWEGGKVLIEPEAMDVTDYCSRLLELDSLVIPLGDGYSTHQLVFEELRANGRIIQVPEYIRMSRAAHVIEVGKRKLAKGECADMYSLTPDYLRLPEAESAWVRRQRGDFI